MPQLADYLTGAVLSGPNRAQATYVPILDRTELQGKWRLTVERIFSDAALSPQDGPVVPMPITTSLVANELIAGFSKMGLKMEKTTVPVEMLVIDHLDQVPTDN